MKKMMKATNAPIMPNESRSVMSSLVLLSPASIDSRFNIASAILLASQLMPTPSDDYRQGVGEVVSCRFRL